MENALILIVVILVIIIIALVIKIGAIYRAMDSLIDEYKNVIETETNNQIRVNTSDRHIRRTAIRLNEELKDLREAGIKYNRGNNELKTAIVNISHDLRTPLTAISGYLDLLEAEEKSPDVDKYISIIGERVEALKSLTEELFKYSVVTTTVDDFAPESLTLNAELEQALAGLYGAFVDRGITPEISIPEAKVVRTLDYKSVQRIFSNILSNALKYSEGDLSVCLADDGEITFANKASEISATDVGKLFNRFFTVESAHHSTGLGLSIAKLLTEKNGGTISADLIDSKLIIKLNFPEV